MKKEFTFKEAGEIFKQVYAVESKFQTLIDAEIKADKLSRDFDERFKELNYTFMGATQADHDLFDQKCKARDAEEKASKAAYKTVVKFAEMVGIGQNYDDIIAEEVKAYIKNKFYYNGMRVVRNVKYLAKRAAERIEY